MDALSGALVQDSTAGILVISLVKGTLILTVVQLIINALPSLSSSMRHLLLITAISTFLIIPAVALLGPALELQLPQTDATTHVQQESSRSGTGSAAALETSSTATASPATPRWTPDMFEVVLITWALVSLVLLGRLVRSAVRVRGIVRTARRPSDRVMTLFEEARTRLGGEPTVRVLQSEAVPVPMAWGVRRGTLLLPIACEEWSDEDLRATFIHELGHLRRLDYLSLAIVNLVSSILWFHPQIWSARGRALAEGERACDDLVVRTGERASGYASHLLQVARMMPRRDPLMALLAMARPSQLEGRMYALLSPVINRTGVGRKHLMAIVTLFLAVVVPFSMMQFTLAAAAPPVSVADSDDSSFESSISMRGSDLTCSDYDMSFGNEIAARAEERLDLGGRSLTVHAARNGGVRLHRSTTGSFTVIACKAAGGNSRAEAEQQLSRIALRESGGMVTVEGSAEGNWSAQLIVGVPDGAAITTQAHNGPITISGVDAEVEARVTNGPISLAESRGRFNVEAVNGPLTVSGMSGDVEANVQNGPLTVDLEDSWMEGQLKVSVVNGPLTLKVPAHFANGVEIGSQGHGPFTCSLPECSSIQPPAGHRGPWRPREIRLGDGDPTVFIRAGNGPISITSE